MQALVQDSVTTKWLQLRSPPPLKVQGGLRFTREATFPVHQRFKFENMGWLFVNVLNVLLTVKHKTSATTWVCIKRGKLLGDCWRFCAAANKITSCSRQSRVGNLLPNVTGQTSHVELFERCCNLNYTNHKTEKCFYSHFNNITLKQDDFAWRTIGCRP